MKPKNHPFAVLLLVCLFLTLGSQASEKPGIITGKVIEAKSNEPVAYANIALMSPTSGSVVAGIISDESGRFKLKQVPYGNYRLQISYLGYERKLLPVELNRTHKVLEVGAIELTPKNEQLDEVVIEEERLKGKQEVDRTVYTVNNKVQEMSTDGMDVLKQIPGVTVDFQDNVTLEGTGNILYQVNGITRDKDFVAQLNPDDFNKVEIVTNPGVEYEADIDAVINIVLKKRPKGGRGKIAAQLPNPESVLGNQNASIEYGNDKFRVFLSDRLLFENFDANQTTETRITNGNDVTSLYEEGSGNATWLNNSTNYGIDLFLNDKNTINLYGSAYLRNMNQKNYEQHGIQKTNDMLTKEYDVLMNQKDLGIGLYHSLFYEHKFDEKHNKITSQVNYYNYKSNGDNRYEYTYSYLNSELTDPLEINRFEDINNKRNMIEWKNDYQQMLGSIKMKAGYWSYYQWYDNKFEADQDINRDFKYNEFRQEAYASAGGSFGKLQWNGGLRMSYSRSRIDAAATNEYMELLPQLSLKYGLSKTSSLKFSARRRIYRPDMGELNPFETQADSLTISRGNPNLEPELINRAELQYAINFKSNYIAPKAYIDYTTNSSQQTTYVNNEGISVIQPDNVGKRYEYGLSLTTALNITRWMRLNANVRIFNTEVNGPDNYQDEKMAWGINSSVIFSPWKDKPLHFMAQIQYRSPRLQYKSETIRDPLIIVGADYQINEKWKVSGFAVPANYNFTYAATERTDTNYYYKNDGNIDISYFFAIEIAYNFKWGKEPKKLQRSTDYEKDGGGGTL
ncbi:hypothetical protein L21SP5_01986 [Salinivirga cyanobacteriivorans]|uniref:Outer membrane protein beta-barrel domain-containing protein n=1 Tax=Salinivirga cyanobacteriivorans TaxID=1307839 RepID=A0A0S2HZQ3_9BACT|nr:outer membrane beta-barrel family protein [Salinivirga cyanobacteriivorans]ALO15625.1 hypothetical protein L21SP5_01986 [Salinivirga cyanobacteriivorans]